MSTIEETPLRELEETALERTTQLLHSSEVERMVFTSEGDDPVSIEILIGKAADSDGHILLSTFGLGGSTTTGQVNIDEDGKFEYRTEFFSLASNLTDAYKLAEVLAKLAFIVDNSTDPLLPGMILGGILPEEDKLNRISLSDAPIGVHAGHRLPPVVTKDFAVFWTAVTLVTDDEAQLVSTGEEGWNEFQEFLTKLDIGAYDLDRKTLSK